MRGRIEMNEVEIPVPYGKLAAKTWFEETDDCKRVLALHGWQDNAGTFDLLIPKLKHEKDLFIFALDFTGHGKSSQFPPGVSYNDLAHALEMRKVLISLNWVNSKSSKSEKKFTILGHSLGAGIGLIYASMWPDDVEDIIAIDFIKTRTMPKDCFLDDMAQTIDRFISLTSTKGDERETNKKLSQVVLSYDSAITAIVSGHKRMGELNREQAICLLNRSIVPINHPPNSVVFARDLRLTALLTLREHLDINQVLFCRVKCNLLFILAPNGLHSDKNFLDNMQTMVDFYKARAQNCRVQWLNADHYVHLNRADDVADIINRYLKSPKDYEEFEDKFVYSTSE